MSGFWSTQTMRDRLDGHIKPFRPKRIMHGAYHLSLGDEAHVTGSGRMVQGGRLRTRLDEDHVVIPPGQFALLLTEETVEIPKDAIGFISIRSQRKLAGLVNVSGFHVDPGYKGKLTFAVLNAGSSQLVISAGEDLFLLWCCSLDRETEDPYDGQHNNRARIFGREITKLKGPTYNPTALAETVNRLDHRSKHLRTIGYIILGAVATMILEGAFDIIPGLEISFDRGQ